MQSTNHSSSSRSTRTKSPAFPTPSALSTTAQGYLKKPVFEVLDSSSAWLKIISEVKAELAQDAKEVKRFERTDSALKRTLAPEAAGARIVEKLLRNLNELPVDIIRAIDKDDGWKPLVKVLARTDKQARPEESYFSMGGEELTFKLVRGVHASKQDKDKVVVLLEKLASYQSPPHILNEIVDKCGQGSNNPFKTARIAKVRLALNPAKEEGAETAPKEKIHTGVGASGVASTRAQSQIYDPSNPAKAVELQEDALRSFFGTFAHEGIKEYETRQKKIVDRSEGLKAALLKLFDADLLDPRTDSTKSESLIFERHAEVHKALRAHIEELRGKLIDLRYGDTLLNFTYEFSTVKSDPGGSFLGRIARLYQENGLSEAARKAYEQLSSEEPLSIQDERLCLEVLILEDRMTKSVDKATTFAQLKSDLAHYKEVQQTNPALLEKLGVPNRNVAAIEAEVQDALGKKGLINCLDAARVFSRFDFVAKFCVATNRAEVADTKAEIDAGIAKLKHLFTHEDNSWRIEAKGRSAPLGFLRERAAETAAIGAPVEISHRRSAEATALLDAKELQTVKQMIHLAIISGKSEERFYGGLSIDEFKKLTHDFLVICRKKEDFDLQFEGNPPKFIEAVQINQGEDIASITKPKGQRSFLTNRNYKLAEEFESTVTLAEAVARFEFARKVSREIQKNRSWAIDFPPIKREAEAGLFRDCVSVKNIKSLAEKLVPAADLKAGLDVIERLKGGTNDSELVSEHRSITTPLDSPYFYLHEAKLLQKIAALAPHITKHGLDKVAENNELMAKVTSFDTKEKVEGSINGGKITLQLKTAQIYTWLSCKEEIILNPNERISFLVPEKLKAEVKKLEEGYIPGSQLPDGWLAKLHRLTTGFGKHALQSETATDREIQRLRASDSQLYSKALVKAVQDFKE